MFPSPCGDVVLKLNVMVRDVEDIMIVSVPLRGCGFKIWTLVLSKGEDSSFRPLAGMWF